MESRQQVTIASNYTNHKGFAQEPNYNQSAQSVSPMNNINNTDMITKWDGINLGVWENGRSEKRTHISLN